MLLQRLQARFERLYPASVTREGETYTRCYADRDFALYYRFGDSLVPPLDETRHYFVSSFDKAQRAFSLGTTELDKMQAAAAAVVTFRRFFRLEQSTSQGAVVDLTADSDTAEE